MALEGPGALEDPDCTVEEGSPGVDRNPEDGHNLEGRRTAAEVADCTVAEAVGHTDAAEEEGHLDCYCSSHRRDYGHPVQHHHEKAANLNGRSLIPR